MLHNWKPEWGELTESKLREKLVEGGYRVTRYVYPRERTLANIHTGSTRRTASTRELSNYACMVRSTFWDRVISLKCRREPCTPRR